MPLNVRQFGISWFLVLFFVFGVFAQAPTTADVIRERITKAKALIAVKNYNAAIYEMEGIRRETKDATLNNAVQVMLMNCYLEQGDYKRAQALLIELFTEQKSNKPNANYYAVAAQVVKGARSQLERYKSLGLTINDRNLPIDAVNDVSRMRETIESVIEQSKTLGDDKRQNADAMALLEEAISARGGLASDDYDAKRWKNEIADVRESIMNSRAIVNAVDYSGVQNPNTLAANTTTEPQTNPNTASMIPVSNQTATQSTNANLTAENKSKVETPKIETPKQTEIQNQTIAKNEPVKTPEKVKETTTETKKEIALTANVNKAPAPETQMPTRSRLVQKTVMQTPRIPENKTDSTAENAVKNDSPLAVGSLIEYATEKVNPVYPPAARTVRMTGTVRVDLVVDEKGNVEVENTSGPSMLQRAALDAVKRWKFKPFLRDGQPVKAKGYVSFSFNL